MDPWRFVGLTEKILGGQPWILKNLILHVKGAQTLQPLETHSLVVSNRATKSSCGPSLKAQRSQGKRASIF